MRAHAGDGGFGVGSGEFEVEVAVQFVEADVTGHLRPAGAEQAAQHRGELAVVHHASSGAKEEPRP